uniref:DUF4326 domain-containing protein n=1 Tax=Marseillevirus LCMAC101 TaxID=2506602 RepID=A0A481YTW9_9VIRU|nr:MAG: protein of unknown function DUF4326 [Marseillevirus LCMAC101]
MYIGRDSFYVPGAEKSKWYNPFSTKKYPLEDSLQLYKAYVKDSGLKKDIKELNGKTLGCWCKGTNRCHGDVLVEIYKKDWRKGGDEI